MKTILRIILIVAFLALMLFIPAVPVLRAPSLAIPEAEIVSLSLFNLLDLWINRSFAFGWTIFWEWYSSLALGLLLAIMASVSLLIARLRI